MKGENSYFGYASPESKRNAYLESRATLAANLIQPDANWLTTEQATELLGVTMPTLHEAGSRHAIDCKSRSRRVSNSQSVGLLWWKPDLERVKTLRRECRIGLAPALRVLAAEKERRI